MELYVYETPHGPVADFRSYLDGRDHSFDDHRKLEDRDPRWEKIRALRHPETQDDIGGRLRYAGRASCRWRELMVFPIAWHDEFEPVDWEEAAV